MNAPFGKHAAEAFPAMLFEEFPEIAGVDAQRFRKFRHGDVFREIAVDETPCAFAVIIFAAFFPVHAAGKDPEIDFQTQEFRQETAVFIQTLPEFLCQEGDMDSFCPAGKRSSCIPLPFTFRIAVSAAVFLPEVAHIDHRRQILPVEKGGDQFPESEGADPFKHLSLPCIPDSFVFAGAAFGELSAQFHRAAERTVMDVLVRGQMQCFAIQEGRVQNVKEDGCSRGRFHVSEKLIQFHGGFFRISMVDDLDDNVESKRRKYKALPRTFV